MEETLDVSRSHFRQYTHISLSLGLLRLRLKLGGGANDIRFDIRRTDVDAGIFFGLGLTLMECIGRMIGARLCRFGTIKREQ
jgi:hypothetical protein